MVGGERKSEDRVIGAFSYKVRQLGAREGSRLLVRLSRIVAKGLDMKGGARVNIGELIDALSEAEFLNAVDTLAPFTEVNMGKDQTVILANVLDAHFAGKYAELLEWLTFAVEVNYRDFFVSLPVLIARAMGGKKDGSGASSEAPPQGNASSSSSTT